MSRTQAGYRRGHRVALAALAAGVLGLALAGCSSVLSEMPQQVGGLPEGVPARPAETASYPAVNDLPQARDAVMTDEERKKLAAEMAAAKAETARRAGAAAD